MTMLLILLSRSIAGYYGDLQLESVIKWTSLSCFLMGFGAPASALLSRELNFKVLNASVVISYAVGFLGCGIPMALLGLGVYALITSYLVQTFLTSVLVYASHPHPVRPLLWQRRAPSILSFSATVLATNLVNWVMSSLDRLVVSWTLGLTSAGLYANIQNFITTPSSMALTLLQSVLYAASSRTQENREQLRRGFRTAFGVAALFTMPVFISIGVVSETFVAAVFGQKWTGGSDVLLPLSWAMPAYLLMGMAVPLLWTSGRIRREFLLQFPMALLWALGLYAVARLDSLRALSWTVCALYVLRATVISGATLRALDISVGEVPRLLGAGVAVAAFEAAVAFCADRGAMAFVHEPLPRLLLIIAVCAATTPVGLRLARKLIQPEVILIFQQLGTRDPTGLGPGLLRCVLGTGYGGARGPGYTGQNTLAD
jgi:lipopolysaccharide exporter